MRSIQANGWGGFARFFYTYGFTRPNSIAANVAKRLSGIVGQQRPTEQDTRRATELSQLSLGAIKAATIDALNDQLMAICGGNVQEYHELKKSDIATYLLKFEDYFKRHGKESNS